MSSPRTDILTTADVEVLVHAFYDHVRSDELLGPIFNEVIGDGWDKHLARMVAFWETVLLEKHSYTGRPFVPHANLPVNQTHFDRWLQLFGKTLDEHFSGPVTDDARWRASKMAVLFLSKIEYIRENPGRVIH